MYDAFEDSYCYKGTGVLKNNLKIRNQETLETIEQAMFTLRATEGIRLDAVNTINLKKLHHHLFKDVYPWAGKFRTVRISKDNSHFCYPEYIEINLDKLFAKVNAVNLTHIGRDKLIELATDFLAEINAIHPFREGNGRTQNLLLSYYVGLYDYDFQLQKIEPNSFLNAMLKSFNGDNSALYEQLDKLVI